MNIPVVTSGAEVGMLKLADDVGNCISGGGPPAG